MKKYQSEMDRRQVLASTLAIGAAAVLPGCSAIPAVSESSATLATWTRHSITTTQGRAQLASYRKAIKAMLALPPTDPRNWYRQAILHLLDCPHGNWWFFNWHRPFLGYFEEICRELSQDQNFALPYWDWTADPALPAEFWGADKHPNYLDPTSTDYFYADAASFESDFWPALDAFWTGLTVAQKGKLAQRHGATTLNALKSTIQLSFAGGIRARGDDAKMGKLNASARKAVDLTVLRTGLAADRFNGSSTPPPSSEKIFNSTITANHSGAGDYEVIEAQPHNHVHGSIGGLMGRFLSPADPIFWLHHANIDRIWTVWSRLQQERGLSDKPSSDVSKKFYNEEYLFFVDGKGRPVTKKVTASDYMTPDIFDYAYAGGSEVVAPAQALDKAKLQPMTIDLEITEPQFSTTRSASAQVSLGSAVSAAIKQVDAADLDGVARITFTPIGTADYRYVVALTEAGAVPDFAVGGQDYVGSFVFFGPPHAIEPTRITLSLASWLAANQKRLDAPLTLHLQAEPTDMSKSFPDAAALTDAGEGRLNEAVLQLY